MKCCYLIRVKYETKYSCICEILNDEDVVEECEHLISLGYDIIEVYRLCCFNVHERPMMFLDAGFPMSYDDFFKEVF